MTEDKKIKVVFDPAFFELFDGTQEELDNMIAEINQLFEGKTAEEIRNMSRPVEWDDLDDEEAEYLENAFNRATSKNGPTLQ